MATGLESELRWPLHKRFWVWLLRCGAFSKSVFLVAAGIFYQTFVQRDQVQIPIGGRTIYRDVPLNLADVGLAIAIMLVLLVIGVFISVRETRSAQKARDREGSEILEAVLSKNAPRYYLYLRPFFLTRHMDLMNPKRGNLPTMVSHYSERETTDLETMLERAVRKSGPLIALGQPGEMIGAGRLAVPDAEWKLPFEALARRAVCIFVIPSHTTGTTWEVKWLRDNAYLAKCVFIMPPKIKTREKIELRKRKLVRITVDMNILWEKAASVLAESDFHLPAYSEAGLLFTLNDAGAVRTRAEIGDAARLRTNMAKIGAIL
jgi:hypothetical protein